MNIKTYCRVSASLFTLVAVVHLTRLIFAWPIQVEGETIPMFASVVGLVVPGGLALWGFRESRGDR